MQEFQQHLLPLLCNISKESRGDVCWAKCRPHLLFVNDVYPGFDVRESVGRCQDGFTLELLVQLPVSSAIQREGRAVHEAPQVVVLVKVSYPVLHLIRVKVRLHIGNLDVCLQEGIQVSAEMRRPLLPALP